MRYLVFIPFVFCFGISVFSQTTKTHHVGWLFLIGDRAICFPKNAKEIPLARDFFKCKKRIGGQQYAIDGLSQEELKSKGVRFIVKMFYGLDTIGIVPITFDKVITDDSRRSFRAATREGFPNTEKLELFYKQKKLSVEFSYQDSSYIVNLNPYLLKPR